MAEAAKPREVANGVVQVFLPLPFKPTIINVWLVRAGATWTLISPLSWRRDRVCVVMGPLIAESGAHASLPLRRAALTSMR